MESVRRWFEWFGVHETSWYLIPLKFHLHRKILKVIFRITDTSHTFILRFKLEKESQNLKDLEPLTNEFMFCTAENPDKSSINKFHIKQSNLLQMWIVYYIFTNSKLHNGRSRDRWCCFTGRITLLPDNNTHCSHSSPPPLCDHFFLTAPCQGNK